LSGGNGGARGEVAAGAARLLSARALVAVIAMIFIVVSTRILTLTEMAVFALYNTLCGLQAVVCSLGLLTTCTRELPALLGAGDREGAARLLRTSMAINALLSAVAACALAAVAGPLSAWLLGDVSFAPAMRWVALGVFIWNIFEANQLFLVALQRFDEYARAMLTGAVAQRALSIGLFLLLDRAGYGLTGYVAGFAFGSLVGFGRGFRAVRDLASLPVGFAPPGAILRYSLPFYADGYLRWLYMQADQLLVAIFLSPEILSLYFVSKRFMQYYQQAISSTIDPLLAKVGELRSRGREAVERSLRSATRYFSLVFVPIGLGAASMSLFLLDLAGGEPYREAAPVLALLAISVTFYAGFNLVTGYVYMLGSPFDRLKHNSLTGLVHLALMAAVLAAFSGTPAPLLAAAAAIALTRTAALLAGAAYAHRQLARAITPTYDLSALPRALAASLLMAAAAAIPQIIAYSPFTAPLWGLMGAAIFILIIRPGVRPEDLDLLTALLRGRLPAIERGLRRLFNQA
jgi:O-antigen/teichoic acid export membrane protein